MATSPSTQPFWRHIVISKSCLSTTKKIAIAFVVCVCMYVCMYGDRKIRTVREGARVFRLHSIDGHWNQRPMAPITDAAVLSRSGLSKKKIITRALCGSVLLG